MESYIALPMCVIEYSGRIETVSARDKRYLHDTLGRQYSGVCMMGAGSVGTEKGQSVQRSQKHQSGFQ